MKSPALLFDWPHRHRIHLLLPAMLALAVIAHAGVFFLFSVASPPVKPDGLHPARVYFLRAGSTELAQLESILASNDPALFAPRHAPSGRHDSIAAYTPQYASPKTALLGMPPRTAPSQATPPPEGPVSIPKKRTASRVTAASLTSSSLTSSSPELALRLPSLPNGMVRANDNPLESVSFFVGVLADGTVAHIVPSRSSGNPALDLRSLQILKALNFAPNDNVPITWGFVDLHFGSNQSTEASP